MATAGRSGATVAGQVEYLESAGGNVMVFGKPWAETPPGQSTATNLTSGYTATAYNAGTKSSGTLTPDPLNGNMQRYINGGAHTLAAPTLGDGDSVSMVIQVTNNGSAGAITTSAYTLVTGDVLTTTSGHDFLFYITKINGFSHLSIVALQ